MKNQYREGPPTARAFAYCPTTILAGDPVLIGTLPAVALNDYQAVTGGAVFEFAGGFYLEVVAVSQISPAVGKAINPGDPLFAVGTLDVPTNVTHTLTISATAGDTPFGRLDPSGTGILTTVTDTAAMVLLEG